MHKIIIVLGSLILATASTWSRPSVGLISIFLNDEPNPLTDTDTVMHGAQLRLEVGASASPGNSIQRVEFFRYGNFIGEGALGANGNWSLVTEATAPVFSASDEPSSTLLDFDKNNGSFEEWESNSNGPRPVRWHRGSDYESYAPNLSIQEITSDSHSGTTSVKITGVPDYNSPDGRYTMRNWLNVWFYNNIGMAVGNPYRITFYAKRLNGGLDDKLEVGAGYGNTFKGDLKYSRSDGDWQYYEILAVPKPPPLGDADQIVFTSRKKGTSWLIDTVEVNLLVDSQDIYQARVIEDTGRYTWSDYNGVKTTPFQAKINFQTSGTSEVKGFQQDNGEIYRAEAPLEFGWAHENQTSLKPHAVERGSLLAESTAFVSEEGGVNTWELKVPNGEFLVTVYLPPNDGVSEKSTWYSLMIEDKLSLNGKYAVDGSPLSVTEFITVADGRLTLSSGNTSDENRVAAIEVTQISVKNESHVYRRGNSDRNDRKTTIVALDGQAGFRSVDLSLLAALESKPMHYSAASSGHTISAHEPISNFGSWKGPSELLTDVTYDFGVSAGNVYKQFDGLFRDDILSAPSTPQTHALKGFYLTVRRREDGSFVERLALDLPVPETQEWNALIHEGMRKKFVHARYGLSTWIRIQPSSEWNYAGASTVGEYNYVFTHMADANSIEYTFMLEAASSFYGTPVVQFVEGKHNGINTTNLLYSMSFDVGEPWRKQHFELSHSGETLPSFYHGTDPKALSMADSDLSEVIYRFMNSSGTGAGDILDYSSQTMVDQFENNFSSLDDAPEFKNHPLLDELVAAYNYEPLALVRYVHNEIEVTDYVGIHPGLTATNIPVEVSLGGLRRDALAVLQEGQGNPREICILLVHLLRLCGVPAAIAEPSGGNVYLLDTDYGRLIGQKIAGTELTPKKIPLDYPWVVAYVEDEDQAFKHLFPWIKETELTEGSDLYDLMPEHLNTGFKYFEKFIRADDEVMLVGPNGEVDASVRGYDDDQPYVLWPALMKKLCAEAGVSFDSVGIRKINRPQHFARWGDFPRPLEIHGQPILYNNYVQQSGRYDTVKFYLASNDGNERTVDLEGRLLWESMEFPLMDLHNRSVNIDYTSGGQITVSIAPFLPYSGPVSYVSTDYPAIGAADYVSKAKLGYQYIVKQSASSAEFAYREHRQRSFDQTFQQQQTRYFNFYGNRNFWNSRTAVFDSDIVSWQTRGDTGILSLGHNEIRPGNYAFCYNYGAVTEAMLDRYKRDMVYHDYNVIGSGNEADETVSSHRLFSFMGQAYWRRINDYDRLVAEKHKLILPGTGGALFAGMELDGNGELVLPFVDVSSFSTSVYPGGHLNPAHGWDLFSAKVDFAHVSHLQGSAYEHAILRNFLGAEGAYSTVKVLQQASLNHRADPKRAPDIVVLGNGPNARGKDWNQEGNEYYQGKRLKHWRPSLWDKLTWHLDASSRPIYTENPTPNANKSIEAAVQKDAFEIAFMPPGPVEIDGISRIALATVTSSGSGGMYISSSSDTLNGGGAKGVVNFFTSLFSGVGGFFGDFFSGVVDGVFDYGASSETYTFFDPVLQTEVTVTREINFDPESGEWVRTTTYTHFSSGMNGLISVVSRDSIFNAFFDDTQISSPNFYNSVLGVLARSTDGNETDVELVQKLLAAIRQVVADRGIVLTRYTESGQLNGGENKTSYSKGNSEHVGDPVNIVTGGFYVDTTDLTLAGPFSLQIRRNYSSKNTADNGMGFGWKFAFAHYLEVEKRGADSEAILYAAEMDGSVIAYRRESLGVDRWTVDHSLNPQLKNSSENGAGSTANLYNNYIEKSGSVYTLHAVTGETRVYGRRAYPWEDLIQRDRPYLDSWHDAHGNGFKFSYYEDPLDYGYGNIKRIHSTNGAFLGIKYNSRERVSEIFTNDGRSVQYNYNNHGDLKQVTLPDRSEILYYYAIKVDASGEDRSTHLISRVEKPLGRILENDYDSSRRVIKQRSSAGKNGALLEIAEYDYTHAQQLGEAISGHTLLTAVNGGVTRYDYADGQITTITDAENNRIEQEWYTDRLTFPDPAAMPNASRLLAETTIASLSEDQPGGFARSLKRLKDKRGRVTYFWYDAHGNIVQTKTVGEIDGDLANGDEVATSTTAYNDRHLPTDLVDPIGNIVKMEYRDPDYPYLPTAKERRDSNDTLISRTERAYTEVETLLASAFGLNSEVRQAVASEDESFVFMEYSENGFPVRVTQYTDENDLNNVSSDHNVVLNYIYDSRGLLLEETDNSGAKTTYQYDPMDRLAAVRAYDENGSLLSTNLNYYNAAGDLEWHDGPRTGAEDYTYMRYDGAGRLLQQLVWRSQASADGDRVESFSQHLDEAFSISQYCYDGFGNLTGLVDPNGHETRISYDNIGRKLGQDQYEGAYVDGAESLTSLAWTYESGGNVHTARNTLGGVTEYLYTDLGALRLQRNPDGAVFQYRYHLDGRIAKEIYPSGNELRYTYDDLARTVTRTLLKDTGEQLSQTVQYFDRRGNQIKEIDAEGYVHHTTFDDLNRAIARHGPAAEGDGTEQQLSTTSYDPGQRAVTTTDASRQSVTAKYDALGRLTANVVRDAQSAVARETYFDYSSDHQSSTRTEGSGEDAVRVTTWTNTQGQPVLVQHHLESGGYDFERLVYDASGNRIIIVDALGYRTQSAYDGLGRIVSNALPNGATTEFHYIDQGKIVQRVMPGGLTHEALFDAAGRVYAEALSNPARLDADGKVPQERRFTYEYFSSGREIGHLKVKRHRDEGFDETYTYDDFLRLKTRFLEGNSDLLSVSLAYAYDKRGLVTEVEQSTGGGTTTQVKRIFNAYGQIRAEQVSDGGVLRSSIAQTWNSEGLRSGIRSASDASLLPIGTLFGGAYHYDFTYTAASRLASVNYGSGPALPSGLGEPYAATYLTNGRVDSVDAYRLRREHEYDARGRLTERSVKNLAMGAVTLLHEHVVWTKRSKMATYSNKRAGRSWGQQKAFSYSPRGQLTGESFLAAMNAVTEVAYDYDVDRLGVLTGRHVSGGISENWDALELDALARLDEMTEVSASHPDSTTYTATGISGYGEGLRAWHNGQPVELDIQEDPSGETVSWSTELTLSPGSQLLELQLANPHAGGTPGYDVVEKRYFSVKSASATQIQIEHDRTGRVTRKNFGDGSCMNFIWDALGRLLKVEKRDALEDGYNWSAHYDGLGRRLRVTHTPVVANIPQLGQANVVDSVYDPQFEFLELGVKVNANSTRWKVYGPDLNGRHGGLHGIGGLLAIHAGDPASGQQIIDDIQGNILGQLPIGGGTVAWYGRDYAAYGPLGAQPQALELAGDVVQAFAWRGYRADATGLFCMGARYYAPVSGRFLAPDPLGHTASMDLYSFAGGDPVNFVDPTGRNSYGIDGTAFAIDRGIGGSRSNVHDFINRIDQSTGERARYFGGPGTRGDYAGLNQAAGGDTYEVADLVYREIKDDIANQRGNYETINLVGWSRGAVAAVEVADRLGEDGIEVNYLGLYDAVEMVPNLSEILPGDQAFSDSLPSNVVNFAHAQKTGPTVFAKDSLIPFPTSDYIPYWQDTNNSEQKFALTDPRFGFFYPGFRDTRSTHGDIGVNPTNTGAHQFILDSAAQAGGVPLTNTDAAAQITDPVAGNNPPAPGKPGK